MAEIRVEGLRELQRALRAADRELAKELRVVFNAAAEIVAEEARGTVPARSGRLRESIKPRSTQREGRVQMGTPARVPYAGWIEFGGAIRPRGAEIRRPFVRGGRFLFPAFARHRPRVLAQSVEGVDRVMRKAGLL